MNTPSPQTDDPAAWTRCPAGALVGVASRMRSERGELRSAALPWAAGSLLVVAGALAGWAWWPASAEAVLRMNCRECIAHFDGYRNHLVGVAPLDRPVLLGVEAHMKRCDRCRRRFESKWPGVLSLAMVSLPPALVAGASLLGVTGLPGGTGRPLRRGA